MGLLWDSVTGGFVALDDALRFTLDLYEWPSFMFARHGINGWFPKLAFDLMPFCDFREVSTTVDLVDIGTHSIDRDAIESPVTPTPLTVEADGEGALTCDLPHYPWPRFVAFGRWDNVVVDHISSARWYRVEHGNLAHVSPCEVTL